MKSRNVIFINILALLTGMIFSSLCITHSETWRVTLSIFLVVLILKMGLDELFKDKD